jgi:EpsI family protein
MLVMAGSLAAGGLAYAATPRKKLADMLPKVDLEAMFPKEFGEWTIDRFTPVVQPSPEVQAKLNELYNQTLARTYLNSEGQRMMLSVAYGGDQSDGLQMHLPEVCYPSQGFDLAGKFDENVLLAGATLPLRRMQATLGRRIEQVSYWTVIGENPSRSGFQRKMTQLKYSAKGFIPDGFLIRVSNLDPRSALSFKSQNGFIESMLSNISPENLRRLT